jgi:hypothetical protein
MRSQTMCMVTLGVGPDARQLSSSVLACLRGLGPGVGCGVLLLFAVLARYAA